MATFLATTLCEWLGVWVGGGIAVVFAASHHSLPLSFFTRREHDNRDASGNYVHVNPVFCGDTWLVEPCEGGHKIRHVANNEDTHNVDIEKGYLTCHWADPKDFRDEGYSSLRVFSHSWAGVGSTWELQKI